jgi:choline monooxygenase
MRPPITIDEDIARANTLPGFVYRDPDMYERQRVCVFARSWQFIGDESLVRVPGAVFPLTMLEGCLDEPLVLTRDFNDNIHLLSNVCTHRSNLVVEGASTGGERHLRCRYHGRRFGLDGCFQFMPEFEGTCDFPSERDNLPRVAMERWGPLLFCSAIGNGQSAIVAAPTFETLIGPMRERVSWLPLHEFRFDASRSRDYLVRANWALYCDNYLEGFHIPFVHAGLTDKLDYGSYRTEVFEWCNLQLGIATEGEPAFDLPASSPDHGSDERIAAYYWWLWPNTMFNFYPWGLSINIVKPLAVDRTRISFLSYVWDETKLDQGAGAALDRVEREDEAIVEAVQRGVMSRFYESGRYSPTREQGVHHFHRLLARALNE